MSLRKMRLPSVAGSLAIQLWETLAGASCNMYFWRLGEGRGRMHQLWVDIESKLAPGVKFYLTVLLTIAAANSISILVSFLDPDTRSCHSHLANSIHTKHLHQVQQGAF